jgi:hypothetical protein
MDAHLAADRLIDRLKDDAFAGLEPGAGGAEARGEIVEELETAPQIERVHDVTGKPKAAATEIGAGVKALRDHAEQDGVPDAPGSRPNVYGTGDVESDAMSPRVQP